MLERLRGSACSNPSSLSRLLFLAVVVATGGSGGGTPVEDGGQVELLRRCCIGCVWCAGARDGAALVVEA
jgi:hypothetical protein